MNILGLWPIDWYMLGSLVAMIAVMGRALRETKRS